MQSEIAGLGSPTLGIESAGRPASVSGDALPALHDRPTNAWGDRSALAVLDALGIAALICRSTAQVEFATAAARRLLARGDAIRLMQHPDGTARLATTDHASRIRLERSIATAAGDCAPAPTDRGSCTLAIDRGSDAMPLMLAIAPFASGSGTTQALIVVSDSDVRDDELASRIESAFGLTRAETRLAVALARGMCRKEFARSVGVRPSTVKTQITSLFAKLAVRRESDLVRILMSVPRLANPGALPWHRLDPRPHWEPTD